MYAVVHPPNFPIQAAAHGRPELRKRPFVLLEGEPPTEVIFATSRSARLLDLGEGMTRLQVECVTGVLALHRSIQSENSASGNLHTVCCSFSPRIEYVEQHPGTYALDIAGMNTLYGDAVQLAKKLRASVMAAGFVANVAVAHNFHAAVCLAFGRSGVSVVARGDEAGALAGLPITVLSLLPEHQATLQSWGVKTCGELAELTEADLIARLGQSGKKLRALSRGEWPHLLIPNEPSFEAGLVERMELDFPVEILESLLFLLARMTDALLQRVVQQALAVASLKVTLKLDNGTMHERVVRPALPLQDKPTLLKLLQLDLEAHPPNAAILGIVLQGQSAGPHRAPHGLFLPQAPEPERTEVLLARLRKLLGENRVGAPELTDDHRPNAFRMAPFAPPPPMPAKFAKSPVATLRVCRPPRAVGVVLSNGMPARVFWNGMGYKVREVSGPWRLDGQWQNETRWAREEWDVRLASESAERVCRLALDPHSNCWYMQGTYD